MKTNKMRGFTIVELLTVMAVIAVLIGLLIPALGLVKDHAKEIQQRAQFHGIDVGLEMFKSEFGAYPDSFDNCTADPSETSYEATCYTGAEKLAEAMVGWDLLGFHPKSGFKSNGHNLFSVDNTISDYLVYDIANGLKIGTSPNWMYFEANGAANIKARADEMVELEHAKAFKMQDVYGTGNVNSFNEDNFVLCDSFAKKRVSAVKTGMPILYFKARINYQFQNYTDGIADDIYNYEDNQDLIALGMAETGKLDHELTITPADTYMKFENMILNTQVQQATAVGGSTGVKRPYKADSYILISAGKDGNYGTADDLFNFDKDMTE